MTEDALIAAAMRNRENRMAQIARLSGTKGEAKAKAEALREATGRVREAKGEHLQMQGLRWVPNFFPTPRPVIERMLAKLACAITPETLAMDPNAGKGDLLAALRTLGCKLKGIELVPVLADIVRKKGFDCETADFLTMWPESDAQRPELMFMNPPFERGSDCKHIQHAYEWLCREPGRRCQLIAVCSQSTGFRLREWVEYEGGTVEDLPDGSFANSDNPTMVRTALVSIIT